MLSTILGFFMFLGVLFFFALVGAGLRWFVCFMEIARMPSLKVRGSFSHLMHRMFLYSIGGGLAFLFINGGIIRPLLHLSNAWGMLIIPLEILIGWFAMSHWSRLQIECEKSSRLSRENRMSPTDETAAQVAERIVGKRTL